MAFEELPATGAGSAEAGRVVRASWGELVRLDLNDHEDRIQDLESVSAAVWRGDWEVDTSYNAGDIVQHNGSSWRASESIPTQSPDIEPGETSPDPWVVIAEGFTEAEGDARYAPIAPSFVTLATNATLPNERVLTGTSNQIVVTDNGAGSTVVLSTPQNLHTSATPQFARLGLGVAADSSAVLKTAGQYGSTTVAAGNSGTTKTLDWNDGNTQLLTLTDNLSSLTLSNPKDGFRYLIVLLQDGSGSHTVTWPSTVKWKAGTAPTLSTAAGKVDIVTLVWVAGIGASGNYIAAANTDYTPA